jgi:transposase InsO family protein
MMDSGVENVNAEVDLVLMDHGASRLLAQIDVQFSNSMIEALFRQLKNSYLYFQDLTSFESLRNHVDWYLTDANERIPRQALKGATPLEVIMGRWNNEY